MKIPMEIRKIVAFGCGTISSTSPYPPPYRMTCPGLDITRYVVHENRNLQRDFVLCTGPSYIDMDKLVLGGSGIAVLADPEGFLEVNDSTVVISCKQIISDLAQPAIMICDRIEDQEEIEEASRSVFHKKIINRSIVVLATFRTDPDSPRLRRMVKEFFDELESPGDRENFGDVVIYLRCTDISPKS